MVLKPDATVIALAAAAIGISRCADAFAPQHARVASPRTAHAAENDDAVLPPLHSSYLDSLSQNLPPSSSLPDQTNESSMNADQSMQRRSAGIQTYVDTISVLDGITDGYGAGSANTAPYLHAMNEVCDADSHAAQTNGSGRGGGEPSVDCADAIADYLDVVTDAPPVVAGQARPGQEDDDSILQAIVDANVHHQYQQQQQQQQYQPQQTPKLEENTQTSNEEQMPTANNKHLEDQYLKWVSTEVNVKRLNKQNPYAITDIPVDVMISRILDNIEDATQKNNGKTKGKSLYRLQGKPSEQRPTVVVLGTGWAAHAFTKLASTYDLRIVVVSPVNHFVFTPMLASASVGTIEYRSMTEPIRVTNPFIDNFVEGRAVGVDILNKKVQVKLTPLSTVTGAFRGIAANAPCRLEPESDADESSASRLIDLNYDYLLVGVGTSARSSIVPGAKQHCFNLKTSQDSKRLRTAIGEALEYASRPDLQESYYPSGDYMQELAREERRRRLRFVVVGGGPTGVELCGELSDFFAQICRSPDGAYQHLADDISVVLVHGGTELLPAMDKELRQMALEAMIEQGVDVRLNTRLKEVGQDYVAVQVKGSDNAETVPSGLTVWAAGNAPVPFVQDLLSQLPEIAAGSAGRINVDNWLRCPTPTPETFGSILVLGDAACLEAEHRYGAAEPLPQTAQVAGQQGSFAARMLNRGYDLSRQGPPLLPEHDSSVDPFSLLRVWLVARGLEEAPEFTFLSLGLLAYIGSGKALNQVELGDVPIFNYAGRVAFALWRTVYLTKQAATRNQALILWDWLRTEAFGRDFTRL